jgi:hypothetical protein
VHLCRSALFCLCCMICVLAHCHAIFLVAQVVNRVVSFADDPRASLCSVL